MQQLDPLSSSHTVVLSAAFCHSLAFPTKLRRAGSRFGIVLGSLSTKYALRRNLYRGSYIGLHDVDSDGNRQQSPSTSFEDSLTNRATTEEWQIRPAIRLMVR